MNEVQKATVAVMIVLLALLGLVLVAGIVAKNHDNLVRQQTLETCKETK